MEDLIKEKEFKIEQLNVKSIKYFYLLALLQVILFYIGSLNLPANIYALSAIGFIVAPTLTAVIMIFGKAHHALQPIKKIVMNIWLLTCSYMLGFQLISLYDFFTKEISNETYVETVIVSFLFPIAFFIINLIVIVPLVKRKQKHAVKLL